MNDAVREGAGWIVNGFQTIAVLWGWALLVIGYGLARSWARPEPDPIRPSGPIDS